MATICLGSVVQVGVEVLTLRRENETDWRLATVSREHRAEVWAEIRRRTLARCAGWACIAAGNLLALGLAL